MSINVIGGIIGITWLLGFVLIGRYFHKLKWKPVIKELKQLKIDQLGIFELVVYQPDAVAIMPKVAASKIFFGINRARVFRKNNLIVLLPWSQNVFLKRYFRPFQVSLNSYTNSDIVASIEPGWSFTTSSIEDSKNELSFEFEATASRTTKVDVRCIKIQ